MKRSGISRATGIICGLAVIIFLFAIPTLLEGSNVAPEGLYAPLIITGALLLACIYVISGEKK